MKMEQFKAIPKKWGNSIGITIPAKVVKEENIKPRKEVTILIFGDKTKKLQSMFGTLKLKKPTQKVMEEIDQGYDEH